MRLYTRSGDDGSTGLFGGQRVPKDDRRVAAYGEVDELNACIGWVVCALDESTSAKPRLTSDPRAQDSPQGPSARKTGVASNGDAKFGRFIQILTALQSRLFDLGADLATPPQSKHEDKVQRINAEHVAESEKWIDEIDAGNTPIAAFILPGGTELAARLHLARTLCRRAERAMVHLSHAEEVNPQAIIFINRISDLLFAMARRANREAGVKDVEWKQSH